MVESCIGQPGLMQFRVFAADSCRFVEIFLPRLVVTGISPLCIHVSNHSELEISAALVCYGWEKLSKDDTRHRFVLCTGRSCVFKLSVINHEQ